VNVIYYYHIPKCGGSFIRDYLKRLEAENKNSLYIPWNTHIFEHQYHTVPSIIKNIPDLKYDNGSFFLFSSVREPTSYVTSHVNYINNAQETAQWPIEYRWGYDRAINEKWFSNYQSKYLLYNHYSLELFEKDISSLDVKTELQLFDKVYKTDNLTVIKNDLSNKISNVDMCWKDEKINTTDHKLLLSEEQKEAYLANNQIDNWLYETAANL